MDKALLGDEVVEQFNIFCETEDARCLVVPESLKLDTVIPSKLGKGKVLLFVKLRPCVLTNETVQTDIIATELGGQSPFEHLELLANEIFLPVLSNPQNQVKSLTFFIFDRQNMILIVCLCVCCHRRNGAKFLLERSWTDSITFCPALPFSAVKLRARPACQCLPSI